MECNQYGYQRHRGMLRGGLVAKILVLVVSAASNGFALVDRPADVDGNGLIEIFDLQDLDAVRDAPLGDSIHGRSDGCPGVCTGFELMDDLNFDTNGVGGVESTDDYYVLGTIEGWQPIPTLSATFDGHGRTIAGLTQLFSDTTGLPEYAEYAEYLPGGLFSVLDGADVHDLRFVDVYLDETGADTGVLAGLVIDSSVSRVFVTSGTLYSMVNGEIGGVIGECVGSTLQESYTSFLVSPSGWGGGLIGKATDCDIARSFVLGNTVSARYHNFIGGLVGYMIDGSILDSYVSGSVGQAIHFGGLIGESDGAPFVQNTYVSGALIGNGSVKGSMLGLGDATFVSSFYAADATGSDTTSVADDAATRVTLADLQCPTVEGDPECEPELFTDWSSSRNSNNQAAWSFGSPGQMPALRIAGVVRRDSDGDGSLDADDDFPNHWEASVDSDGDGAIDFWRDGCDQECRSGSDLVLDQFPNDPDVTLDLDLDGFPDAWNPSCDATCQAASALTLDPSLDDLDNDGLDDFTDQNDDNEGGLDVDLDSNNLIDITSVALMIRVAYDPTGASLRDEPYGGDYVIGDVSGCRPRIVRGILARECDGYELLADLDLDTEPDGVLTEEDEIYNDGMGWIPIGKPSDDPVTEFQTNFEGHGHTLSNLVSYHGLELGLFGGTRGANIRNLGLIGDFATLWSENAVAGGLISQASNTTITNCYSTVDVAASGGHVGGLVGLGDEVVIRDSFATGNVAAWGTSACHVGGLVAGAYRGSRVSGGFAGGVVSSLCTSESEDYPSSAGGLAGRVDDTTSISESYSVGVINALTPNRGGLIGLSGASVVSSYWATDSSGLNTSAGGAQAALAAELACPTSADDAGCLPGVSLYAAWDEHVSADGVPSWDFGDSSELPGLCLGESTYRMDQDGDLLTPTPCACAASTAELVTNQTFESGTSGWTNLASTIATSTQQSHSGAHSLHITGRSQPWSGAVYDLTGQVGSGEVLSGGLWARVEGALNEPILLTVHATCQDGTDDYLRIAERTARNNKWVYIRGSVALPSCALSNVVAYVEGPAAGKSMFVDDVSLTTTEVSCSGGSGGNIDGDYTVQSSWNEGFCVELVISNPTSSPTTSWSAEIDLNGTTIDPLQYWNIETTGVAGTVTITPEFSWAYAIGAGSNSHSLGFCGFRPPGSGLLPHDPVVSATF